MRPLSQSRSSFSSALWARITMNTDWSTGPLARPFAHSLAPLTRLLAPHYSLRSRAPFVLLITSLTPLLVGKWIIRWLFFCVFSIMDHSALSSSLGGWWKRSKREQLIPWNESPHLISSTSFIDSCFHSITCKNFMFLLPVNRCSPIDIIDIVVFLSGIR